MNSKSISLTALKTIARTLNKTELETKAKHKKFLFEIRDKNFCFTPESTNLPRSESYTNIEKFLERYNQIYSLRPVDYQDISVNASYLLVVIQKYITK